MRVAFDRYELDSRRFLLLREGREVAVEPRVLELLVYLARFRDRVVGKEELVREVWAGAFVSDSALKRAVGEARRALGDDGRRQRFIRTVHGRGYRFAGGDVDVDRQAELDDLTAGLDEALRRRGRALLVAGEAGTGKSALLRVFARRAAAAHEQLLVAAGCCNAHTGVGVPYLPFRHVLEQLTGQRRGQRGLPAGHGDRLWAALPAAAEAILGEGTGLVGTLLAGRELLERLRAHDAVATAIGDEVERLIARGEGHLTGSDPQQTGLIEQVARVLLALERSRPLLLVLDDLQWADAGSIGLLVHLVRRIAGTRVLIVCGYRPDEVALRRGGERHPLEPAIAELKAAGLATEVRLHQTGRARLSSRSVRGPPGGRRGAGSG